MDSKPVRGPRSEYQYLGFGPGIWQHGSMPVSSYYDHARNNFRTLGKRIGLEDLPDGFRARVEREISESGGKPASALRGKHSLKAKAAAKKPAKRKAVKNTRGPSYESRIKLTGTHRDALCAFAKKHGRNWRARLFEMRAEGNFMLPPDVAHAFNVAGPDAIRAFKP